MQYIKKDIERSKLWIGDDRNTLNQVLLKLNELGYSKSARASYKEAYPSCLFIYDDMTFGGYDQEYTKENFDNNIKNTSYPREIHLEDLIDIVNNQYSIY